MASRKVDERFRRNYIVKTDGKRANATLFLFILIGFLYGITVCCN